MRPEFYPLNVPATAAPGTQQICRSLEQKWVQVGGTFVASLDLEITIDGTTWSKIATAMATGALVQIPQVALAVRVNATAFTSGSPRVTLSGFESRSF